MYLGRAQGRYADVFESRARVLVGNETFFLSRTKLKILSQKEMILDRAKQPSSRLSLPQLRCAPEVVRPPKCVY